MRQTFEIPGRLPGTNEYQDANRCNAHKGAKLKREAEELVYWAVKQARLKPMQVPVAVSITWIEGECPGKKTFRPRDKDNIESGVKFVLDALRRPTKREARGGAWRAGIIANDDYHSIAGIAHKHLLNRKNPRIIVEIEEV